MAAYTSAHFTPHGYQPSYPSVQHNFPHASKHLGFYARKQQSKHGQVSAHLGGSHNIQPQLAVAHHSVYPSAVAHYNQPHHKLAHHSVHPSAVAHYPEPQNAVAHHPEPQHAVVHYSEPQPAVAHYPEHQPAVAHYPGPQPAVAHYPKPQPAVAHYAVAHHGLAQGRKPQHAAVHHAVHQHTAKLRQPHRSPSVVAHHGPASSLQGCVNNYGYGVPCRV
jgi:hypothetical protein